MMTQSPSNSTRDHEIQKYLNHRRFSEAEKLIREKLKETPESSDAHYFLGVMHYFQGNIGQSVASLRKSLELNPQNTDASVCLSVLYNDIGRYDEAKKFFESANQSVANKRTGDDHEIDRKFSVKHLEIGDLYFRYRRFEEAIEEYSKAILLDPQDLAIRIRRAKAHAKKGFLTRAIQELQELKNEHQRFVPARIQLGLVHYSQGNILDAELEWEQALEIEPDNREAKGYLEMARRARHSVGPSHVNSGVKD